MPQKPLTPQSAAVFVDAANFYRSIKKITRASAIDVRKVADKAALGRTLTGIHYFTVAFGAGAAQRLVDQNREVVAMLEKDPRVSIHRGHIQKLRTDNEFATKVKRYLANLAAVRIPREIYTDLVRMADEHVEVVTYHEKGVDVALACEMVRLAQANAFDVAYLLSGDADFVPAVEVVRSFGKRVMLVHPDAANRLIQASDVSIQIDAAWLSDCRW